MEPLCEYTPAYFLDALIVVLAQEGRFQPRAYVPMERAQELTRVRIGLNREAIYHLGLSLEGEGEPYQKGLTLINRKIMLAFRNARRKYVASAAKAYTYQDKRRKFEWSLTPKGVERARELLAQTKVAQPVQTVVKPAVRRVQPVPVTPQPTVRPPTFRKVRTLSEIFN